MGYRQLLHGLHPAVRSKQTPAPPQHEAPNGRASRVSVLASLVSAVLGLATAIIILYLVRRDRLHARHALGWLMIAIVFAAGGLFPTLMDSIARWLNIYYPPILAVALAMTALTIKLLLQDMEFARQESRLQAMTQRLAILQKQLEERSRATPAEADDISETKR